MHTPPEVAAACSLLGLDAVEVANEGKLIALVPQSSHDAVLDAMTRHRDGRDAVTIGVVTEEHPGVVVARNTFGTREQLPRIC